MTQSYETMTIAQIKAEIDSRANLGKPYTSKTKKAELISILAEDDRIRRNKAAQQAERKAFRMAPVVPLSESDRMDNYTRQNNGRKLTRRQQRQVGRMARRAFYRLERISGAI